MMNIITSEFYKIFKSKVFYGIIGLLMAMNLAYLTSSLYTKNAYYDYTTPPSTGITGYQGSFSSDIVIYIILVFTASLITAEYSNNTIRQMSCHGISRWKLVLGQYIAISSVITLMLLSFGILNMLFDTALFTLGHVDAGIFIRMNIGLLCIIWGVSGIGTFLSYLIRNGAAAIGACMLMIMFSNLFILFITYLTKSDYIARYALSTMQDTIIDFASKPGDVVYYSIVFLGIGVAAILGSILLFSKRDVD